MHSCIVYRVRMPFTSTTLMFSTRAQRLCITSSFTPCIAAPHIISHLFLCKSDVCAAWNGSYICMCSTTLAKRKQSSPVFNTNRTFYMYATQWIRFLVNYTESHRRLFVWRAKIYSINIVKFNYVIWLLSCSQLCYSLWHYQLYLHLFAFSNSQQHWTNLNISVHENYYEQYSLGNEYISNINRRYQQHVRILMSWTHGVKINIMYRFSRTIISSLNCLKVTFFVFSVTVEWTVDTHKIIDIYFDLSCILDTLAFCIDP